jgi:hypothetical protein
MTPVKQYPGANKSPAEVAVIKGILSSPMGDDYHATITGISGTSESQSVQKRFGLPGFTDYPHEIHVNPGTYQVGVYCFKSLTRPTYRPVVEIHAKPATTYALKCAVADGAASVVTSHASEGATPDVHPTPSQGR